MESDDTRQFSLAELRAMRDRGETLTRPDAPVFPVDADFWEKTHVARPVRKVHTGLRIDADVLDWFRSQGTGFQTHMNAVLRAYVEARKGR